jgi:hypothetical protein
VIELRHRIVPSTPPLPAGLSCVASLLEGSQEDQGRPAHSTPCGSPGLSRRFRHPPVPYVPVHVNSARPSRRVVRISQTESCRAADGPSLVIIGCDGVGKQTSPLGYHDITFEEWLRTIAIPLSRSPTSPKRSLAHTHAEIHTRGCPPGQTKERARPRLVDACRLFVLPASSLLLLFFFSLYVSASTTGNPPALTPPILCRHPPRAVIRPPSPSHRTLSFHISTTRRVQGPGKKEASQLTALTFGCLPSCPPTTTRRGDIEGDAHRPSLD